MLGTYFKGYTRNNKRSVAETSLCFFTVGREKKKVLMGLEAVGVSLSNYFILVKM